MEWGYDETTSDEIAPNEWAKYYATGERQSPINILVPDLDQLIKSTCCRSGGEPTALAHRLANQLSLASERRPHLDSLASETHQRSSSTSSSGSAMSASPSPVGGPPQKHTRRPAQPKTNRKAVQQYADEDQDSGEYDEDDDDQDQDQDLDHQDQDATSYRPSGFADLKSKQNTRLCVSNKKIFLGYPRNVSCIQLSNTGHSWQVDLPRELAQHTLMRGPAFGEREYQLAQLHCHWAEDCARGSEHQLNGQSYAAELHFVHWNCSEFGSVQEASKQRHGLAVLAVMVQALEGEQHRNKHLDKIAQALRQVQKPHSKVDVQTRLDLKKLFPANRWAYASYEGSLTTPPLSEVVDWLVFLQPIQCCASQIGQFRQLGCAGSEHHHKARGQRSMVRNCRPVQPHNNRLVSIWTHH